MSMYRLPRRVLCRTQSIARQNTLVQSPEFIHQQCLHGGLFVLGNTLRHRSLNAGERVKFWLRDERTDGLIDEVTPGQAKGVWLRQVSLGR